VRRAGIKIAPIKRAIEKTLTGEKKADAEVSVFLVGDSRIRTLNRQYRSIDAPTDVLAFAMGEGEFAHLHPHVLGDIVISVDTANRQAKKAGNSLQEELQLLGVHGTLHLLGYEDETPSGGARMRRRAHKYLREAQKPGGERP
jgi:probable rRNA maturation factor